MIQQLGLWSADDLLSTWAVDTPQSIFPGRRIGFLRPGYEASFLVLGADPLQRFEAVQDIRLRVEQGCVLSVPAT